MCAEAESPGPGGGNTDEMDLFCGAGAPGGEEIVLGPPPPVPSSEPRNSGTRRKLAAAEGGARMLSAHSRKLETPHPAAPQLSHRGRLWHRPAALRPDGGQEVAQCLLLGRRRAAQRRATGPHVSAPTQSPIPFRASGKVHSLLGQSGQTLFLSGPRWGLSGKRFTQGPWGSNR